MRINIASTHRFHLLDLARELSLQGHDIAFYSFVPKKRCMSFGLDKKCCHSFTWLAVPFIILKRILPKFQFVEKCWYLAMDYYMSLFMRPCDVYIALGTVYLKSLETAKHKYGAKTILEWGSKYIDEQQRILKEAILKTPGFSAFATASRSPPRRIDLIFFANTSPIFIEP